MDVFEKSILVAAHPDDENLWFSSILPEVDRIILCFLAVASKPDWTEGRQKSLSEYPLENISCLGLTESEVFYGADWNHPLTTDYGLKITENRLSDLAYRQNFETLKQQLRKHLQGCLNVFTHNPWGEYGHVEHVQVYRAVKSLQQEMGFELWFSNYASNKSLCLMAAEYPGTGPSLAPRKTNKRLAESIADIYKRNHCWTWYNDYEWCDEETFIKAVDTLDDKGSRGALLPINLIDVGLEKPPAQMSRYQRFNLKIKRKLRQLVSR